MKTVRIYTIRVEATGKTDFGIKFLSDCLEQVIKAMNGFRKCYSIRILNVDEEKI